MTRAFFQGLAASVLILSFVSCNSDWESFRGVRGNGQSSSAIEAPLALRRKFLLQKHTGPDRFFNQPVLSGNTIYFGSSDGTFYSVNILTGFMNWSVRTNGPINSVPCVDAKKVYFGSSDGIIYAVTRTSGEVAWRFQTGGAVNSTVVRYGPFIVAASDSDGVYVLDSDGNEALRLPNDYWYHNAFQIQGSLLAFAPGSPLESANLAVYDLKTRQYLWSLDPGLMNYPWFSFPAIEGKRLFFSVIGLEEDGYLGFKYLALDLKNGMPLWEQNDFSVLPPMLDVSARDIFLESVLLLDFGAPVLWRGRVIFSSGDSVLRAYGQSDGRELWKVGYDQPISTAVTLAGGKLYFGLRSHGGQGRLVCASAKTGRELWNIPVDGTILNAPVIAGKRIAFGTDSGWFYIFEEVF